MDFTRLIARIRALLLQPRSAWTPIAAEADSVGGLYRNWVLWLAAIPPLATFIGTAVFGISVPFLGSFRPGIGDLLGQLIISYGLTLLIVFLVALVAAALAPNFGGQGDRVGALKLVAYAWTPVWVVGVFNLIPALGLLIALLVLAALVYAIWHLYLGAQAVQQVPAERAAGYVAVLAIIAIVLAIVVGTVSGLLIGGARLASGGFGTLDGGARTSAALAALAKNERISVTTEVAPAATPSARQLAAETADLQPIRPLAPAQLQALMPASLPGWTAGAHSAERVGLNAQLMTSEAKADYSQGDQHLQLTLTDMGSMRATLAAMAMIQQDQQTADGYEKIYTRDGRTVSEQWNDKTRSGKYSVVVGSRYVVAAEGSKAPMADLKQAVEAVDLARLAQMANTPGAAG